MYVADTSAVIRFLRGEEGKEEFETALREGEVLLLREVIMECVYVLKSVYGLTKREVIDVMKEFLTLERIQLEDEDVLSALALWESYPLDKYTDAFVVIKALKAGKLLSLDKKQRRIFDKVRGKRY